MQKTTAQENIGLIGWKTDSINPRTASIRIRCLNIKNYWLKHGIQTELVEPANLDRYSTVIFSKTYKKEDIELAKRLKDKGVQLIFDLCDNHFLKQQEPVNRLKCMLNLADKWVSSTPELAKIIIKEVGTAKPITVIGDPVENNYTIKPKGLSERINAQIDILRTQIFIKSHPCSPNGRLVWFGNHSGGGTDSGMAHLEKIFNVLSEISAHHKITLTIISNSKKKYLRLFSHWKIPMHYCDWSPSNFFQLMKLHNIAIIPIKLNDFTVAKSNNRVALPLNLGLNVVADSIPSYEEFKDCTFLDDWNNGLENYLNNISLAARHKEIANKIIQERYSIEKISTDWINFLNR